MKGLVPADPEFSSLEFSPEIIERVAFGFSLNIVNFTLRRGFGNGEALRLLLLASQQRHTEPHFRHFSFEELAIMMLIHSSHSPSPPPPPNIPCTIKGKS
jgi:hypothetical protein